MSKRILIVEDQEDLRGVLRDLLSGSGYAVIEAADGQDGVAKAKSEGPDLILMDIQMPVLDGYEATRQIKADPALAKTPIIAVSSFAMKGDEEKARASGCGHYVTKPYSPLQLLRTIRASSASKDRDLSVPVSGPLLPFPIAKLASEMGQSFASLAPTARGAEVPPAPDRIAAVATWSA